MSTHEREWQDLQLAMQEANANALELGISTDKLAETWGDASTELLRIQQEEIDDLALSIVDLFKDLSGPLEDFQDSLQFSLLNPMDQFTTAAEDFRRIASEAAGGSIEAIEDFQGAAELFLDQAEAVGASPGLADATREVQAATSAITDELARMEEEATDTVADAVRHAEDRIVDTLTELKEQQLLTAEEIRRLRR